MKYFGLKDIFSFFTLLPFKGDLVKAADSIYLLPLISVLVGAIAGAVRYFGAKVFGSLAASALSVVSVYLIIGIMHLDGFSDFADSLFAKGGVEEKIKVLKDPHIGVAGAIFLYFLLSSMIAFSLKLNPSDYLESLAFFAASDMTGRASIIGSLLGKNYREGLGRVFSERFKKSYVIYYLLVSLILLPIIRVYYLLNFLGLLIGYLFYRYSLRLYGSSNGDVIGASVEFSRAIAMMILCTAF